MRLGIAGTERSGKERAYGLGKIQLGWEGAVR